ncbi:MAG: hypothetical protein AAB410_05080 [Patescibacteria group bacterium]
MKNINLNIGFKSLGAKFKTNTALVFYLIFAAILLYEFSIFYAAVKQVQTSREAIVDPVTPRGVRLRLNEYQEAAKRIEDGRKFYPGVPLYENPFGVRQ